MITFSPDNGETRIIRNINSGAFRIKTSSGVVSLSLTASSNGYIRVKTSKGVFFLNP